VGFLDVLCNANPDKLPYFWIFIFAVHSKGRWWHIEKTWISIITINNYFNL